jgi:hypothetical protein
MLLVQSKNSTSGIHRAKGDQSAMQYAESCSRANCPERVATTLGDKRYCFDHFCSRCYQLLEQVSGSTPYAEPEAAQFAEDLIALDECASRALEIAIGRLPLSNLDRARLLDILLWSGDLGNAMRRKRAPAVTSLAAHS